MVCALLPTPPPPPFSGVSCVVVVCLVFVAWCWALWLLVDVFAVLFGQFLCWLLCCGAGLLVLLFAPFLLGAVSWSAGVHWFVHWVRGA